MLHDHSVAPAGLGAGGGASTVPYGAGWLPPLAIQRPAIFPPRACAVAKARPHGYRFCVGSESEQSELNLQVQPKSECVHASFFVILSVVGPR